MSLEVSLRTGESQESLLRRFQRMVQTSGILREAKAHRHFRSKGEKARLKAKRAPGEGAFTGKPESNQKADD